ncbi:hypothetical protein BH24ACT15_BH24ACT15_12100 [soil metagenome]|jgi:prevent-host-death family protein
MTISVGVHEAKTRLSELIRLVAEGTEVVVTNRGIEVARIAPPIPPAMTKRPLGIDRGQVAVAEDFDAPMDIEGLFYGDDLSPQAAHNA